MADKIRRIEIDDFKEISDLYKSRKDIDELKWLFSNPNDSKTFNGFVATDKIGKIVGAIGYTRASYTYEDRELIGSIFMSWVVSSNYKGFAGISLLKKASEIGDFAFAVSGSSVGKSFYPMLKYNYFSDSIIYYKILKLKNIHQSIHRKTIIRKLGFLGSMLPSYFKPISLKKNNNLTKLTPYNGLNFEGNLLFKNVFGIKITKNYLDWLLNCPLIDSYAFNIKHDETNYGICVLYIENSPNGGKGRFVHLPFLGFNKSVWVQVIDKCNEFLSDKGCSIVSGIAHHEMNHIGYKATGFVKVRGHSKPNYIKDPKKSLEFINFKNWNLQYSEGDKGYRNF